LRNAVRYGIDKSKPQPVERFWLTVFNIIERWHWDLKKIKALKKKDFDILSIMLAERIEMEKEKLAGAEAQAKVSANIRRG